jgi:hypothetical protein
MFVHRLDQVGDTFVSFCKSCFAVVAEARREEDLAQAERLHWCDASELERFKPVSEIADRPKKAHRA